MKQTSTLVALHNFSSSSTITSGIYVVDLSDDREDPITRFLKKLITITDKIKPGQFDLSSPICNTLNPIPLWAN